MQKEGRKGLARQSHLVPKVNGLPPKAICNGHLLLDIPVLLEL